ncbi:aminotransferase class V-fold PLP-dependent enzyme [Epidermidibacterium keratini]|uniref:Aminotransferase class V-fold PLP-dependent enzyme n=1 Tax=Epidermidibacterium keratini TaxID=1891644 RepID=A0A7L4YR02_9ACTN|nr:aminotransferase class V-fold PLP-dependent enzyme [Epidermidibacterium keratini]QHC01671.1 aminotransferase class V-fold PLP-dependent enzyme [Epidermidibacterium keratini]
MSTVAQVQREFRSDKVYLNTASIGLPPSRTVEAVATAIDRWGRGADNATAFDDAIARSRAQYAELVGVPEQSVAIGSQASVMAGIVAADVPAGGEVLLASGDFTSVMFPFLAQQERGVTVRDVPLDALAGNISARTTVVAVSAVQSVDGAIADLDVIESVAREHGTQVLVDVTQAAGWLDFDASRFDYTICSAYKWLMAPRGAAFLTMRDEHVGRPVAHGASWFGGEDVWDSIYGAPLRLASTARRYDASPVWHSWVGLDQSLALLREVGVDAIGEHSVGLANAFRARVGLAPSDSAIVSVPVRDGAADALAQSELQAAMRAGRLRLSFYLYNTEEDVERALEILRPYL